LTNSYEIYKSSFWKHLQEDGTTVISAYNATAENTIPRLLLAGYISYTYLKFRSPEV